MIIYIFFMNPDFFPGDGYGLHYYKVDGIVIGVNTPIEGIPEYKSLTGGTTVKLLIIRHADPDYTRIL
jgi:hypothetical protein